MGNFLRSAPPNARGCKTYIQPRKQFNRDLAHSPFIQENLQIMSESLAFMARNHLAQHTDEGKARILLEKDSDGISRLIILEDRDENPDAMAIEFGHWTRGAKALNHWGGKTFVEGLNVLGGLVGGSSSRPGGVGRGRHM